jgi:hypothetical protein
MRALIALALLATPVYAETMVARQGNDQVALYDKPCEVASVLRFIPENLRKTFRRADAQIGGQRWFACFRVVDRSIHVIYEDGEQGVIPVEEFKESPGA